MEAACAVALSLDADLIFTSTSDVYGNGTPPYAEDDDLVIGPPTTKRWAYAVSKMYDEHYGLALADEHGPADHDPAPVQCLRAAEPPQLVGRPGRHVRRVAARRRADGDPRRRPPDADVHARRDTADGIVRRWSALGPRRGDQPRRHRDDHDPRARKPDPVELGLPAEPLRARFLPTSRSPASTRTSDTGRRTRPRPGSCSTSRQGHRSTRACARRSSGTRRCAAPTRPLRPDRAPGELRADRNRGRGRGPLHCATRPSRSLERNPTPRRRRTPRSRTPPAARPGRPRTAERHRGAPCASARARPSAARVESPSTTLVPCGDRHRPLGVVAQREARDARAPSSPPARRPSR